MKISNLPKDVDLPADVPFTLELDCSNAGDADINVELHNAETLIMFGSVKNEK